MSARPSPSPDRIEAKQPEWFAEKYASNSPPPSSLSAAEAAHVDPAKPSDSKDAVIVKPLPPHLRTPAPTPAPTTAPTVSRLSLIPVSAGATDRAASPNTFRRHSKLVSQTCRFLEVLEEYRVVKLSESEVEGDIRLLLHSIRDLCVAANRETMEKESSLAVGSPRPTSSFYTGDERVGLETTLGIIFCNTLCFEGVPDLMAVQSLKRMLDKFRAAQATGDVRNFQRVIASTVNEILLYTPLDLDSGVTQEEEGRVTGTRVQVDTTVAATANVSSPPPSSHPSPSRDRSVSSKSTSLLRENEFNFFGFRNDSENGSVVIKADECAPWKDHFLFGYASFLQRHGLFQPPANSKEEKKVYVVLPCEYWFSATTAYAQFVYLLISCYFSRGADLLNHTARVHKLVQYFELHLGWAVDTDSPSRPIDVINLDVMTYNGGSDMAFSNVDPSDGEDEMEEVPEVEEEEHTEPGEPDEGERNGDDNEQAQGEEKEEEEEFDPEANIVMHFRDKSKSGSPRPSADVGEEEEEEQPPTSVQRRHKCYLPGEVPEELAPPHTFTHHATTSVEPPKEEAPAPPEAEGEEMEEEPVRISKAGEDFKAPENTVVKARTSS